MEGVFLGVSWTTWAVVAAIKLPPVALMLWLCARIAVRAGYSGWRALWLLVPIGNIVAVWGFAYAEWPGPGRRARASAGPATARTPEASGDGGVSTSPGGETGWVLSGFDGNGDRVRLELADAELEAAGSDGLDAGRSRSCALRLDDESVSRRHALFTVDGGGLCIVDLGSTNGTAVDGRSVGPDDGAVPLERGAQVELGDIRLSVNRG